MSSNNFFAELRRRNVYKVAVAYAVVAWLLIQAASILFPAFEAPAWVMKIFITVVLLGFPLALVFAWAFEITPEGIKRESDIEPDKSIAAHTGRKIVALTIALAVIAAGLLTFQLLRPKNELRQNERSSSSGPGVPIPEKSIAVLPFENLSSDKENAYFTDGVQDEILTNLARVADLKVISRTSVMQYRAAAARNLKKIGEELGVAHLLEGSVQRTSGKLRVNAQLIDARTDAHMWAQSYDRDLADVFAIQSEIAKTIAEQLRARLSPSEKAAIAQPPTTDLVANDLYLRARALDDMFNDPGAKESLLQGISLLEEAVRRDPSFMLAYCLMVETHLDLYWGAFDHTPARRELAKTALEKAERIQPDAGEVHVQKGVYAYHGFRDYEGARAELQLALRALPNSARAYATIAAVDRRQARWDDAVRDYDRAVELDPRNFVILEEAAFTYAGLNRWTEAKHLFERAITVSPKDYFTRVLLSQESYLQYADIRPWRAQLNLILDEGREPASHVASILVDCALAERDRDAALQALTLIPAEGVVNPISNSLWPRDWYVGLVARSFGDVDGAKRAFNTARAIAAKTVAEQPDYASAWATLGAIDAGLGRKADAIAEGKRACELLPLSKDAWDGPSHVQNLALIYAWVSEKDLALEQLALVAGVPAGATFGDLKLSPVWDSLRGDPRFEKIVDSRAPK